MKILFDQGTPAPLRRALAEHEVETVFENGWDQLRNGELLAIAILNGYEVLISTDQSLRHQHDLRRIRLGIVILMTTSWPRISRNTSAVARAVQDAQVGRLIEVLVDDGEEAADVLRITAAAEAMGHETVHAVGDRKSAEIPRRRRRVS